MAEGEGQAWRWREQGPHGLVIQCSESIWDAHAARHPEIASQKDAIRATVRDPDEIYLDRQSTAGLQPQGGAEAAILQFIGYGRTQGRYAGKLVIAVIKLRSALATGSVEAYVQSAYLSDRRLSRLHLLWRRAP